MGLMSFLVFLSLDYWQHIRVSRFSLIYIGLAIIIVAQWLAGMLYSMQMSLLILSYLLFAFMLCNLAVYLKQNLGLERMALFLAKFLVIGGFANAIFVVTQLAFNAGITIPYMTKWPTYGIIAQNNHFANYMAMATASLIYLYAKNQFSNHKFWLGLLAFLTTIAFSGSRSTWLYLISFACIAFIFTQNAKKNHTDENQWQQILKISLVAIPLFALIQAALFYSIPDLIKLPTERLLSNSGNQSNSIRWAIWQQSWQLFLQHPWLGVGAGNIRWQSFLALNSPTLSSTGLVFEHAHNLFIQQMAELGIIAPILTAIALWKWIRNWWAKLNFNLESGWLISLLAIIGIHSLLEYPLWYAYFLGITAFLFGLGEQNYTQFKIGARPSLLRPLVLILLLAGCINLTSMLVANIKIERWMFPSINNSLTREQQTQFTSDYYWVKNFSLMQPYAEFIFANAIEPSKDNIDKKLTIIESSLHNTTSFALVEKYAALLAAKGDYRQSAKIMKLAILMEPTLKEEILVIVPTYADEGHRQELLNLISAELNDDKLNYHKN
jgi:O-antigen ligase